MAKELKVGDKCVYNYYEDFSGDKHRHTQNCTIVEVREDDVTYKYIVEWEDGKKERVKKESLTKIEKQKTTETMETKKEQPIRELKFKVGDVCRYSSSGDSNGSSAFDGELCTVKQIRHEVGYDFPYVISFKNEELSQDYPVKEGALELVDESITIKVSDLKKIHDVACSEWKCKLEQMVKPFESVVVLTESQIDEMFDAASPSQLEVVESVFGKRIKNKLFDFSERFTISQGVFDSPIHIRHGFATEGNENKEIGFCPDFTPIIVIDGEEIELKTGEHGAYLKFKMK